MKVSEWVFVFKKRRHFKIAKNCITLHGHPRIKGKEGKKVNHGMESERTAGRKEKESERTNGIEWIKL